MLGYMYSSSNVLVRSKVSYSISSDGKIEAQLAGRMGFRGVRQTNRKHLGNAMPTSGCRICASSACVIPAAPPTICS